MEKEYDFKFTENEANLILNGLAELPYKITFSIVEKLRNQYTSQVQNKQYEEEQDEVLSEGK
jgi:hypothetical protein